MQSKQTLYGEHLHGNRLSVVLTSVLKVVAVFFCYFWGFFKLILGNTQIQFGNNCRTGSPLIGVCGPCHAKYLSSFCSY